MAKIGVIGATGRMGAQVVESILRDPENRLGVALVRDGSDQSGKVIPLTEPLMFYEPVSAGAFQKAHVFIDFSKREGAVRHARWAADAGVPIAICMTALTSEDKAAIKEISQKIPILMAANTSLGVALMRHFSLMAAEILGPDYDIEILEMHHRGKVDAPSGTVLQIAERLGRVPGFRFENKADRNGVRQKGDIGYGVLRGGGVPADQEIFFAGDTEVLSIKHRALDRSLFAKGAIKGAQWLVGRAPGLYTMDDVLGF